MALGVMIGLSSETKTGASGVTKVLTSPVARLVTSTLTKWLPTVVGKKSTLVPAPWMGDQGPWALGPEDQA
ncbi:hypothetical protein D3C87_1974590 [compost metagenome]